MLRVDLARARVGMELAVPVLHPHTPRQILLRPGYRIEAHTLRRLRELNVRHIYVRYPRLGFLARRMSPGVAREQARLVATLGDAFESLQGQAAARLNYDIYCQTISGLIQSLTAEPDAALFMGDLLQGGDELLRHSTAVTYLAVLMGMRMEGYVVRQRRHLTAERAAEVTNLGVGAMLHDVGVTRLDPRVQHRYRSSGDETDPAWQQHPRLGFEMVRGQLDPSAAAVVLHHHQRADGSGYAGTDMPVLDGDRIHVFARIAAVADQFDRMRRPPHLVEQPTVWALNALVHRSLAYRFDLAAIRALLAVVPAYPPGSLVRLNDQRWAVVLDHSPQAPCRPLLLPIDDPDALADEAVTRQQRAAQDMAALDAAADGNAMAECLRSQAIDLAAVEDDLHIVECCGQNVTDMNFAVPDWLAGDMTWAA